MGFCFRNSKEVLLVRLVREEGDVFLADRTVTPPG